MTVGVVVFPGTNCEADVVEAVTALGGEAALVWHAAERLPAGRRRDRAPRRVRPR